MKIEDCKIGMIVKGQNVFGLTYKIIEILKSRIRVEHRTGAKRMRSGKMEDEVFVYTASPSIFTPVSTEVNNV